LEYKMIKNLAYLIILFSVGCTTKSDRTPCMNGEVFYVENGVLISEECEE